MSRYKVTIDRLVDTIEASDESEAIRAVRFKHGVLSSVSQSAELVVETQSVEAVAVEEPVDEVVEEAKPIKKSRKKA